MTHGCTDCGYDYMGKCEVYEDGTCKRDRAEANTEEKRMTNYEKIKSMTIDEMAEFLCHGDFDCEKCAYKDNKKGCKDEVDRYKKWLEAEEKEI